MNKALAIGYKRVSTKNQWLDRQELSLKDISKSIWVELKKTFEDKVSWYKVKYKEREWFKDLQEYILENKSIEIVIIDELSRLGRNVRETSETISFFKENNIKIYIWKDEFDLENENNELLFNILSSLSQHELSLIKNRSISWKKSVLAGWWTIFWARPYGFNLIKVEKTEKWKVKKRQDVEINEEEAKNIKKMFELIWNEKKTIHYVYAYLKHRNILWIKWKEEFSKSSIKKILNNKLYCGELVYNFKGKQEKCTNETITKKPIISKELFLKVRKQLDENKVTKVTIEHINHFLLKSILYTKVESKKWEIELKPMQTHFEKKVNNQNIRQYRHPSRNTISPIDNKTILSKNDSLITVLNGEYIEKVILYYLWFILVKSNFFDDDNLKELEKISNNKRIKELEINIIKLEKELKNKEDLSFIAQDKINELEFDLEKWNFTINSEREINRAIREQKRLHKSYNNKCNIIEEDIEILTFELKKLEKDREKYKELTNINKKLQFIKNKEFEELIKWKEVIKTRDKLTKFISKIEINDNKEETAKFHNYIRDLKKYWIYKKDNTLLKMIYHSVYNRNKKVTFIKNNAYIIDIIFHFNNWVNNKLSIVYNHKDPLLYFPTKFADLIESLWWDKKSKEHYRLIFDSFQGFNIYY